MLTDLFNPLNGYFGWAVYPCRVTYEKASFTRYLMEIVYNGLLVYISAGKADISIRTDKDQRIICDSKTLVGVPIDVKQAALLSPGIAIFSQNPVSAHKIGILIWQLWQGPVTETKQRELRALE